MFQADFRGLIQARLSLQELESLRLAGNTRLINLLGRVLERITWARNSSNALVSSLISLIEEIEPAGLEGTAEDREVVVLLVGGTFAEPTTLGREEIGVFFAASETEARGRVAIVGVPFADAEAVDPVGDATEPRTAPSEESFPLTDADNDCFTEGGTDVFVGTTEALRFDVAVAADGLSVTSVPFAVVVVAFRRTGAEGFDDAKVVGVAALVPVAFAPAPNVPELIT